jgi:hypothetical protein
MRAIIAVALVLLIIPAAFAAEVKIKAVARDDNSKGVKSTIMRKPLAGDETSFNSTDDNGSLTFNEPDCDKGVMFRAVPVDDVTYLESQRWESCASGNEIVFTFAASKISVAALKILKGTQALNIPDMYKAASAELSTYADRGDWGAVAKLASQMSAQFRETGKMEEAAAVYGQISTYSTARVAIYQAPEHVDGIEAIFANTARGALVEDLQLTTAARASIARFQSTCGVEANGVANWATMGCLPGGKNYKLPSAVLIAPSF